MDTIEYPGDIEALIEFVNFHYNPKSGVTTHTVSVIPPYADWVDEIYGGIIDPRWHVSKTNKFSELNLKGDFVKNFPHSHNTDIKKMSMMLYLTTASGGELVLFDSFDNIEIVIKPKPGLCAFVDGMRKHGVKPVLDGERLAIIVIGKHASK